MKCCIAIILGFLLLLTAAYGQTDNTLYVRNFSGATVAGKLTAAMQVCTSNAAVPCLLVLDPSLAAYPSGSLPSLCSHCYLMDYRNGPPNYSSLLVSACSQPGATADVQINAAIASLGGQGGIVDLSCYGGSTQTISATVNILSHVTLQGSLATTFQPGSASVIMFAPKVNSYTRGIHVDLGNLTANTFTGQVFSFTDDYYPYSSYPTRSFPTYTSLEQFVINGVTQNSGGAGIFIEGTSDVPPTQNASNISIRHGYISGLQNEVELYTTNGWVNGNSFEDIGEEQVAAGCGFYWNATVFGTGLGIYGNMFTDINYEDYNGVTGAYGVCTAGNAAIQGNTWWNSNIWDAPAPLNITNAATQHNMFQGMVGGAYSNGAGSFNSFLDLFDTGTFTFGGTMNATAFNLSGSGQYSVQGHQILGPNGTTDTSVYSQQAGGHVVDSNPSGGWAMHQASLYQIQSTTVIDGSGNVFAQFGTNVVYRCATAGNDRAGVLTTVSADCGSTSDTGLRVH